MAIKRITTNLIEDGSIGTIDIANNAITAAKITDGNITTAKLADLNVTAGKLAGTLDLTGKTVTVATATTGDSDTSPASTAFVQQEIAALVDSSPSSLNTLNELAAALGDDASFSTTVTNSIATKLPLAGGTMTGDLKVGATIASTGGTTNNRGMLLAHQNNTNQSYVGRSENGVADTGNRITFDYDNDKMQLDSDGDIILTPTSNVGIGTSSPSYKLEVESSSDADLIQIQSTAGANNTVLRLGISGDVATLNASGGSTGSLAFKTYGTERMRIHSQGNITNTGPSNSFVTTEYASNFAKLDVRGNGIANSTHFLISYGAGHGQANELALKNGVGPLGFYTSTQKRMTIDSSGNVLIGTTTSPFPNGTGLAVNSSGAISRLILQNSATGTGTSNGFRLGAVNNNVEYENVENGYQAFYNNGAERMRIDASGKVGIGTNSPTSKISVVGGAADPGISIKSGGNAGVDPFRVTWTSGTEGDMFIVDDNGNVGIGTSSPESRLHISNKAAPANDVTLLTLQNGNGTGDIGTPDTFIDFVFKDTNTNVTPQARIAGHAGDGGDANTQILEGKGYLTFHTSDTTAESGVVAPPERMRITAAGEVVIGGTEVPSTVIDGTGAAGVLGIGNSSELYPAIALMSSQRNWLLYQNSLGNFQIYDSSSNDERFRLDTKGTMMTGASFAHNTYAHAAVFGRNSTPDGTVVIEDYDVSSGIGNTVLKCYLRDQDPATLANFIVFADGGGAVGSITHNDDGGGVSFNTTSDYRLKENIDYDWDATTLLKQLKPAKFNFISNSAKTVQGFLAHEVSDIVPSSVRGDKDHMMEIGTITDSNGDIVSEDVYEHFCKTDEGQAWTQTGTEPLYQQLDYARLVPLLTKAMQEQQTLIESLTARIETLEG